MTVFEFKRKKYSPSDVEETLDGLQISVELPCSGDRRVIKGEDVGVLLLVANQMVENEIAQQSALGPYSLAVDALLDLALHGDSSGAAAAAQVLLAAHNANFFHLDLTDLCSLDSEFYQHALAVIEGRVTGRREPHTVVENGEERFRKLWEKWEGFHAKERYARFFEGQ